MTSDPHIHFNHLGPTNYIMCCVALLFLLVNLGGFLPSRILISCARHMGYMIAVTGFTLRCLSECLDSVAIVVPEYRRRRRGETQVTHDVPFVGRQHAPAIEPPLQVRHLKEVAGQNICGLGEGTEGGVHIP